ncbi:hypothetical protein ABT150_23185 [Streptomyces mirabilis]|uniref:hypothetical protein n=1 Tax=Streptomyces mirabilis TaxID=68239 RepID=UPI00332D248F
MTDQTVHQPLADQQLDEIETRAAHLYEYATLAVEHGPDAQPAAERVIGTDVPALVAEVRRLRARVSELEGPAAETPIGSIAIRSESVQLDNGENLRDLAVGDSVNLRPDTGHEGLWVAAAFHGDFQERITLQHAEVVVDCGNNPVTACEFSGTRHAHPVDLDGKVRPRPTP